jgi:DNA-directed RNA polymerase subunit RPC12/RpoP
MCPFVFYIIVKKLKRNGGDNMSIITMWKKCPKCGRKYTYNPSTGDLGLICPYCALKPKKVFGKKAKPQTD